MIKIQKLRNDIPVIYEDVPGMKSTSFGIFVKMGSALETKENSGISHVIEHMLFKGTSGHNVKELADIMSDYGGGINAYTAKEVTSFYGRVLNEDVESAFELMAEMLFDSVFGDKELAKEKHVIIDEIDLYDDSAEDVCHELLQKKVWKNSPYGYIISGSRSNVRSFTREKIVECWKTNYVPDNMVISVAGGIDEESLYECLERNFGSVERANRENEYPTPEYEQSFLYKNKDTEQVHMNIAFNNIPSSHPDRYPMCIINAALGGNLNSRLFLRIREEMGLTYSIYSYSSSFNGGGLFHIYASMNPNQSVRVLEGIYDVIKDFTEKGMSEEELATVKKQLRTEMILSGESATARMNSNAKSYMVLGRVEDLDETIDMICKTTKKDIDKCLKEYLDINKCSLALIGDLNDSSIKTLKKIWSNK